MLRSSALESDLADELLLLEFEKDSTNPNPSRRRLSAAHFLQEILDSDIDDFAGEGADEGEEEELEWLADKNAFPPLETSFAAPAAEISGGRRSPVYVLASALPYRAPAKLRSKGLRRRRRKALPSFISVPAKGRRKCRHCESEQTPQWRTGPDGPKTLCNACGVRFKSGRLVPEYRPANSPTFSAAVHSNSHRRIVEMRRQKYGGSGGGGARRSFVHGLAVM